MSTKSAVEPEGKEQTVDAATPAPKVSHLSASERVARGKAAREDVPRASHSALETSAGRDPVAIVDADTPSRVPELVPIRYGRMLVSPFTFYRGAASLMAHDLAATPRAGLKVQLCGDAHLSNFGGFASPSRDLVFDLNDFDETLPGPFEWDVKRLAASFEIAGRDRGFDDERAPRHRPDRCPRLSRIDASFRGDDQPRRLVFEAGRRARCWRRFASQKAKKQAKAMERGVAKAQTKDSMKAFAKLTHEVDGEPRIISDPPLIVPIAELAESMGIARRGHRRCPGAVPGLPPHAATRSPRPARELPLRRSGAQGRRRGQRRHARAGSSCCSDATTATRCSCRSRRPDRRCSSRCSAAASTATTASASSRASG